MAQHKGIDFAAFAGELRNYLTTLTETERQELLTAAENETPRLTLTDNALHKLGKPAETITYDELLQIHRSGEVRGRLFRQAEKLQMPAVWLTSNGFRPDTEDWAKWNGGFLIDLDLIDKRHRPDNCADIIATLKAALHRRMCRYDWYAWCNASASGTGLHIRTHSQTAGFLRLLECFTQSRGERYTTAEITRIGFYINLLHKYALCWRALLDCEEEMRVFGEQYGRQWLTDGIDCAMFKIAQCAIAAYDPDICANPGFRVSDFVHEVEQLDAGLIGQFLELPKVQRAQIFRTASKREQPAERRQTNERYVNILEGIDLSQLDKAAFEHYDKAYNETNERYKLYWMTEVYFYQYTGHNIEKTKAFCRYLFDHTSKSYRKMPDNIAHIATQNYYVSPEIRNIMDNVIRGVSDLRLKIDLAQQEITYHRTYILRSDEYVSKHLPSILADIPVGGVGVLCAGAGTGKTDAVMSLVEEATLFRDEQHRSNGVRMLVVEPYKSIVQSKFGRIGHLAELLYEDRLFEGRKPVCVALVDKFFDIDLDKVHYDYIVVDESHLMLMSEYRAKCGLMMQRLMNTRHEGTRILLMSGTPVFEQQFFPDARYFRIDKEESRRKTFHLTCCRDACKRMYDDMAADIAAGKQIVYIVQSLDDADRIPPRLEACKPFGREIRCDRFFSNARTTDAANNLLHDHRVGDADIVFVSAVLSVGIDILEGSQVVFYSMNPLLTWVDIEQYGNRLRGCDITFNLYAPSPHTNPNLTYRDFALFRQPDTAASDEIILQKLNEEQNSPDRLMKMYDMSYFQQDNVTGTWRVVPILKEIHDRNGRWQRWSRQQSVTLECMKRLGYETTYNRHIKEKVTDEEAVREDARCRKRRSNAKYRFVRNLLDNESGLLRKISTEANTYCDIQHRDEVLIELVQTGETDTIYTCDTETMRIVYTFLLTCNRLGVPFDDGAAFIRSCMTRNNQISLPTIVHLTQRLYYNRCRKYRIPDIVKRVEMFGKECGDKITKGRYAELVGELTSIYFGHERMNNDRRTRDIFERFVKDYYQVKRIKRSEMLSFRRYDTTFENRHDVRGKWVELSELEELMNYLPVDADI